jgi:hypothetical protein
VISRLFVYLFVLAVSISHGCTILEAREPSYCLSFSKLDIYPNERLSKFDLHINSAIVVSLPRVPMGWRIEIDNEPNWMPEISGIAIEQAADLEKSEFSKNFINLAGIPPELVKYGMTARITVSGYLELSHRDAKRVLPISNTNVTLTPDCRSEPKR